MWRVCQQASLIVAGRAPGGADACMFASLTHLEASFAMMRSLLDPPCEVQAASHVLQYTLTASGIDSWLNMAREMLVCES